MKKIFCAAVAAVVTVCSGVCVFADGIGVEVNGNTIDAQGVIVESRTLVPVRGVFEELGYTVEWDADTKTATLSGEKTVVIQSGSSVFTVDGNEVTPEVPQQIIDGRFMLPLRAVGEAVGAEVEWNGDTKTVVITKGEREHTGLKVGGTQKL